MLVLLFRFFPEISRLIDYILILVVCFLFPYLNFLSFFYVLQLFHFYLVFFCFLFLSFIVWYTYALFACLLWPFFNKCRERTNMGVKWKVCTYTGSQEVKRQNTLDHERRRNWKRKRIYKFPSTLCDNIAGNKITHIRNCWLLVANKTTVSQIITSLGDVRCLQIVFGRWW